MSRSVLKLWFITAIVVAGAIPGYSQNALPEVFTQGSISDQLKYLDEHTRIYDNYRAIREDMYQITRRNALDTLTKAKARINGLVAQTAVLGNRIDSLNKSLEASGDKLSQATRTKNSIRMLGIEVNKSVYNTVMWTILAALLFFLIAGFLSFKRNHSTTLRTKADLEDLKKEFEDYRQKVRIEREKTNLEHFNEIKKLKGGGPK
jgi:hypothetical protein